MTQNAAEEKLNDYLMNGVQAELYWAEEARSIALMIGNHSGRTNSTRFSGLFGRLQEVFSERETLAVAKMFDRPNRYNPVRSIGATITVLEENLDNWVLPERSVLDDFLHVNGQVNTLTMSDREVCRAVVAHFKSTLPTSEKKGDCPLSASLDRVFQSRDKVHAHNEAISPSLRKLPSWKDTKLLCDYAVNFVQTIAHGFLGIATIIIEPNRVARLLELLMATANLTSDEFGKDERNVRVIQRLRKELSLENSRP